MIMHFAGVAVLCASTTAFAGSSLFSVPFQFGANNGSALVQLPQFAADPQRTLSSVGFTLDATIRAKVRAENVGSTPGMIQFSIQGDVSATGVGIDAFAAGILFNSPVVSLAGADANLLSGTDFINFGTVSASQSVVTSPTQGLEAYSGNSSLPVVLGSTGRWTLHSGNGNTYFEIQDFEVVGTATITYTFSTIPGPGALALVGVGGLFAGRRRRAQAC
ncbi:MAG: choice-of-anchor E domain-containing protein [Phycisphaerales bacterium]